MIFPSLENSSSKKEEVTKFNGTVSALHPSAIPSSYLSDSLNVFNDEGILKNRKGFHKVSKENLVAFPIMSSREQVFFADFPFTEIEGFNTLGVIVREEVRAHTILDFFVLNDSGDAKHLFFHEIVAANGYTTFEVINAFFVKSKPVYASGIFLILPIIRTAIRTGEIINELRYFEFSSDFSRLDFTDTSSFYCPLIMKHGHGNRYVLGPENIIKETVYPEGVNILNGAFEADFTVDDNSDTFKLPVSIRSDAAVKIHYYTAENSKRIFTIPANETESEKQEFLEHQLYFKVDREKGEIYSMVNNELYSLPWYYSNNALRIFSFSDTSATAFSIFSHTSKPVVFDGRLFFPGGIGSDNKIYFSGKNEPLYYSDDNCFTLGDSLDSVTALSKQGRYIIGFKKKEIYRITLSETPFIERSSMVDNDSIKKIPCPEAKVVRINDTIGCDRPATIKICGNRLVWYNTEGAVYSLYGSNLYTEGSVYELSAEIKDKLLSLSYTEKRDIKACEILGRYALITKNRIFIMDTKIGGFSYLSGHKNADKNLGGLSWFFWESPQDTNIVNAYSRQGKTYFVMTSDFSYHCDIFCLKGNLDTVYDENYEEKTAPVNFSFTTALMGKPDKYFDRFYFHLYLDNFCEGELYDINGNTHIVPFFAYNKFIEYIIPLYNTFGQKGIRIYGSGRCELDHLSATTKN